jgi:acetyl/propionyl-CoA carboxylase alpha subunit
MTFEIEVNGRTRTIAVERAAHGRYHVVVDGRPHEVDAARVGNFGLSMLLDREAGLSREVQVAPGGGRGEWLVTIDGRIATGSVNRGRTSRGAADSGTSAAGEQTVAAPMPGRVVRVLVKPGDDVAARQGVVVIEAMKMENELRSPKAGRVKDVHVTPGTSVEAGRVLVVIE